METINRLAAVKANVEALFASNEKPYLLYHNLAHTQRVVMRAREISNYYSLGQDALFVVQAAAWFHDTGHLLGSMEGHEAMGVRLMRMFLGDQVEASVLSEIEGCIMATRFSATPLSLPEMILCDADTYHLGTPEFKQTDALVWREMEMRLGKVIDHQAEKSLRFLEAHQFYTGYCQELLNPGKIGNILWLSRKPGSPI